MAALCACRYAPGLTLVRSADSAKAKKVRGRAYRMLGQYLEAAKDLRDAQRYDYDPDTNTLLKEVEAFASKIEAKAAAEKLAARKAAAAAAHKRRQEAEAAAKAAAGAGGGRRRRRHARWVSRRHAPAACPAACLREWTWARSWGSCRTQRFRRC